MWDEDLSEHDLIGSCDMPFSSSDFDGGLQAFRCLDPDGLERFSIQYFLRAAE
jgi:hypothetical protein